MTKTTEVSGKLTTELGHWCYAHPQEAADRIEDLLEQIRQLVGATFTEAEVEGKVGNA